VAQWIEAVIRARFLVAGLGEMTTPPWWRTEALTLVGQRILVRLFPRTSAGAGLETAGRAAAIEHDSHIGRVGAYHLFRLPIGDETTVLDHLRLPASDRLLQELVTIVDFEARLDALRTLANDETSAGAQGPVHCGAATSVRRGKSLQRLCATYADAFNAGQVVYPYLTEVATL
jgi:hypothetical protein